MKLYAHVKGEVLLLAEGPEIGQQAFGANVHQGVAITFVSFTLVHEEIRYELQVTMEEMAQMEMHVTGVRAMIDRDLAGEPIQ